MHLGDLARLLRWRRHRWLQILSSVMRWSHFKAASISTLWTYWLSTYITVKKLSMWLRVCWPIITVTCILAVDCLIVLKFGTWVHLGYAEAAECLKSTYRKIQDGSWRPKMKRLNHCNLVIDCLISLKLSVCIHWVRRGSLMIKAKNNLWEAQPQVVMHC